jgi:Homeodomain-like domain
MPEIQSSESQEADRLSSILAGYLTPKDLAQALGVSERTVARWHRFREGPPRVEIGRRSSTVSSPSTHGSRRVNAMRREPIGADGVRACARSGRHVFRSRCSGTTSARFRDRAAATIEAKRFVA